MKYFKILIIFLLISIGLYFILSKVGLNGRVLREYFTYSFLIQFAIIIAIKLKSNTVVNTTIIATNNNETLEQKVSKYKTSNHSKDYLREIASKLHTEICSNKSYLKDDLTLDDLAQSLKISRHTLSQVITEILETNFYDLINKFRLDEFVEILKANPSKSISEIFYECGFKSRTTFYKYFNKHRGESPTNFKDRLLSIEAEIVI